MDEQTLVAIDGSEPAKRALHEALRRFRTDHLVALHVLDTSESSHGVEGGAADGLFERKRENAKKLLGEAQATAATYDVELETAVETGRPARAILEYVTEHGIDHIVIGSHGRSGIARLLLGSVAEEVIRNSPVSVTVVRAPRENEN